LKNKFKYGRHFILFKQEDSGYGNTKSPSGFIQLDIKADKCRFSIMVQDFRDEIDQFFECNLYAIKCREGDFKKICLGKIPISGGKGETYWDIDSGNIKGSGLALQDFDVISLLLEDKDGKSNRVICPLAAYIDGKVEWRKKFEDYKKREITEDIENVKVEKEVITDTNNEKPKNTEDAYVTAKNADDNEINLEVNNSINSQNEAETSVDEKPVYDEQKVDDVSDLTYKEDYDNAVKDNNQNECNCDEDYKNPDYIDNNEQENGVKTESRTDIYNQQDAKNICDSCYIRNTCTEVNRAQNPDICNMYMQGINQSVNFENNNQYSHRPIIEEFTKCMNSLFEQNEPFGSKRKDYTWWKINSPVQLNNVLYRINLKNSILFNPKVLMAHFKYRHLIMGIYKNAAKNRQYIVYGVPGVYGIEDRPFGNVCRWAQVEGGKPRYGAFGYWLIYLEPDTGKIITVV